MTNIPTPSTNLEAPLSKVERILGNCFTVADNAKRVGDYRTANLMFSYIFSKEKFRPFLSFEYEIGNSYPYIYDAGNGDDVDHYLEYQYYSLFVLRHRDHYLCIPVTLLSIETNNQFVPLITKKYFKGDHNRLMVPPNLVKSKGYKEINTSNIHLFFPDMEEPEGFFYRPLSYKNWHYKPVPADRNMRRLRPILNYLTHEERVSLEGKEVEA